jgi:RNA polymerase sigma-70 factor (ECF subfamily)
VVLNHNSLPIGGNWFITGLHPLLNSLWHGTVQREMKKMNDFHRRLEEEIPRLRRYARALTRNSVRADDLVQDTLTRAIQKEHLWQPGTHLRVWLFTILHNQNVNTVRRAAREANALNLDDHAASLVAISDPTASRKLVELERALGRLPEEQRQVIFWSDWRG